MSFGLNQLIQRLHQPPSVIYRFDREKKQSICKARAMERGRRRPSHLNASEAESVAVYSKRVEILEYGG